ncbi:MAG: type II secretion system F family protein [Phycisphaerales bacterium JB039]
MRFAYRGYDQSGRPVSGVIDAADTEDARHTLRRQSVFATDVRTASHHGADRAAGPARRRWVSRGARLKRTAAMMKQLSLLIGSGTTVVDALIAVERQAKDPAWQRVIARIRARVEEGAALSEAMRAAPEHFDPICASLVAAGEAGASLEDMLTRLAQTLEREAQLRSALTGAMVYPLVLMTASGGALITLVLVVLPRFAQLFNTLQAPLPMTTRILMSFSDFLRSWWWAALLCAAAGAAAAVAWARSEGGRSALHGMIVRAPQLGQIARSFATARITRLLGILLSSHVPLVESLRLVRESTWNCRYASLLEQAEQRVTRGEPISDTFDDPRLIEPAVAEVIRTGEQSGQLAAVLTNIAAFKDHENETIVRSLTSLLEPVILLFMGALVALVAISMFLPLFDLASSTGGAS